MKPLPELTDDALADLARRAKRELPDAPHWLIESAVAMWRAPAPVPTLGQRIAAVLGFDSWGAQPALALRSALPVARHLLFTAEGRDVDVRVSPADPAALSPQHFAVAGQVLGPGDGGMVSIERAGEPARTVALDAFGEFWFAGLPPGAYRLTVAFGDDRIELPPIDVGGEPGAA